MQTYWLTLLKDLEYTEMEPVKKEIQSVMGSFPHLFQAKNFENNSFKQKASK